MTHDNHERNMGDILYFESWLRFRDSYISFTRKRFICEIYLLIFLYLTLKINQITSTAIDHPLLDIGLFIIRRVWPIFVAYEGVV